jgi:hypothetical protein
VKKVNAVQRMQFLKFNLYVDVSDITDVILRLFGRKQPRNSTKVVEQQPYCMTEDVQSFTRLDSTNTDATHNITRLG